MITIQAADHVIRVGEIQDYVAAQIAALDTGLSTPQDIADYILSGLRSTEGYQEEKDDERLIRRAIGLWSIREH